MRLLNVETLKLSEFFGPDIPPYGILSHRWGESEVSYQRFVQGDLHDSNGFDKIYELCAFVRERRIFTRVKHLEGYRFNTLQWVWIDTCCIDKTSSAELSEAINSMYMWYSRAVECYVYLQDVPFVAEGTTSNQVLKSLEQSEWFTRGWTLQELLAPGVKVFCNKTWDVLGHICVSGQEGFPSKHRGNTLFSDRRNPAFRHYYMEDITSTVSRRTGIQIEYLRGESSVYDASVARRMSWAAERQTTRVEDSAYCLLGLFDVNMPLLYGEGQKAYLRLQEEIIKRSDDQSIFVWSHDQSIFASSHERGTRLFSQVGLLAPHVHYFKASNQVCRLPDEKPDRPYSITNIGLHMQVRSEEFAIALTDPCCIPHCVKLAGIVTDNNTNISGVKEGPALLKNVYLFLLQCLHKRHTTMWYRSRCNDLFIHETIGGLGLPIVDEENELEQIEVFAPVHFSAQRQCKKCWQADEDLISSILLSAS